MSDIFSLPFSSLSGLGEISVSVDPFTGESCLHIPAVVKHPANPILTKEHFFADIQRQVLSGASVDDLSRRLYDVKDLFNPGLAHVAGGFAMLVRFQNSSRFNDLYLARSADGLAWSHSMKELALTGAPDSPNAEQRRQVAPDLPEDTQWYKPIFYDPRITEMEDGFYLIALAADYDTVEHDDRPYVNICDNVLYKTTDFESFEFVGTLRGATRNAIVFPRKIGDYYYAACRPNTENRIHTVLVKSRDLKDWQIEKNLFRGGHGWMIYAGPGFPPFETEDYWVMGVHAVETHGEHRVHYRAGVCLLDKESLDVLAGPVPILNPDRQYEMDGTVDNVIFPTGILFSDGRGCGIKSRDTKCAIYYGAADSSIGVGVTTVGRLIDIALGKYNPLRSV